MKLYYILLVAVAIGLSNTTTVQSFTGTPKGIALQDTSKKEKKGFLKGIFGKKKTDEQPDKKNDIQSKINEIERQKKVIQRENELLSEKLNSVDIERQKLGQKVEMQAKDIESMSLAQAKSQLLLARQKAKFDSLSFINTLDSLQIKEQSLILSEKEAQLANQKAQYDLRQSQVNLLISLAGIVLLVAGGLYYRMSAARKVSKLLADKNQLIIAEQKRSDELLLNILPQSVADELKIKGAAEPRHYDEVTVLFSDFTGFTTISEQLTPKELVEELDACFKGFDEIITKYKLEKIKTIGDAYMAAGGLPNLDPEHPRRMVLAALEIQHFLFDRQAERSAKGLPSFQARIGIHTGEIVAGVVGLKKFAYDIWGDTVNVASRMESNSMPGRVNISTQTHELVKDFFECESRGKINAKNKGEIEMFFVITPTV
jgi:adenylate cyclase